MGAPTSELRISNNSGALILATLAQAVIHGALFAASIYGLFIFAKGDSKTPTFWALLLLLSAPASIALDLLDAYQMTLLEPMSFDAAWKAAWEPVGLRATAISLVWALYWMRSKRVRLTFGSNAFKQPDEQSRRWHHRVHFDHSDQ